MRPVTDPAHLDEAAFAGLVGRHRRELHVHCYRMLASFEEAEDVVQETFLRAWDKRASFTPDPAVADGGLRPWLYRIATNACIDQQRRRQRQLTALGSFMDIPWLTPYPDRLLDELASPEAGPDAVLVAKETIELTFLAAIQLLPGRQRAALLMRDVLGWSAVETAAGLETTVAAANSALQRARATLQEQLGAPGVRREDWTVRTTPTVEERALLRRFIDAHERQDVAASVAAMHEDIRVTMPPLPMLFAGRAQMLELLERSFGPESDGDWRLVPTAANRQPAAASYLRRPGDTEFRAFKLDLLRMQDGAIIEATTFGPALFEAFGLPDTLSERS